MPESNRSVAPQPRIAWRFAVMVPLAVAFVVIDQISKIEVRAVQSAGAFPIEAIRGVIGLEYVENRGGRLRARRWLRLGIRPACLRDGRGFYGVSFSCDARIEIRGRGPWDGVRRCGGKCDRPCHPGLCDDFLTFRFFDFPSFNVADIGITVGVVVALIGFAVLSPANAASGEEGGGGADGR